MMSEFEHQRHKAPTVLHIEREVTLVCSPFRSNVNLSRIVRFVSSLGLKHIYATCSTKVDRKIARDGADQVEIRRRRSMEPLLKELGDGGYTLVGLEQTTNSEVIWEYAFPKRTALVLGNERRGL